MRIAAIIAAVFLASTTLVFTAGATPTSEHLVTICHATPPDTAANGYNQLTVDVASVGFQHSGHQDQHAADIIPPYAFQGFSFPGLNWTTDGQAIYDNGCALPEGVEPPITEEPPPAEITVCRDGHVIELTIPPDTLKGDDVIGTTCPDTEETEPTAPPPVVVQVPAPVLVQPNTTG